jgi:hypothetical protein
MRSSAPGRRTLGVEVTNISPHGFWMLIDDQELFLPFEDFPWFQHASILEIADVRRPSSHHLHWPTLDVDLAVESLRSPDRYPMLSRVPPRSRSRPAQKRLHSKKKNGQRTGPRS